MTLQGRVLASIGLLGYGLLLMRTGEAHGFGQRYDLPLPLDLYIWGAAATVALSFVLAGLFLRVSGERDSVLQLDLLHFRVGRMLAHPLLVESLRVVSVGIFLLIVLAGLIGVQNPFKNIAPTLIWVIWWVGMAYVSALLGNLWALINPWTTLFRWSEMAWKRYCGCNLSRHRLWPESWGVWPAVGLFFIFAWLELVWPYADDPSSLAYVILLYSLLTWTGMFFYGRETWLRHAEVFSLVFGLFARFAPLSGSDAGWILRPYAVGLLVRRPVSLSLTALAVLLLATVTFDGFSETPGWLAVMEWVVALPGMGDALFKLSKAGIPADLVLTTAALLIFPSLFFLVFLLFSAMTGAAVRILIPMEKRTAAIPSVRHLAGWFVLTLVPISIAYHLSHYLSYLAIAGQYAIPIASDPFGFGWDLFGTKLYLIDIGIVTARFVWYTSLIAIVVGHVVAVYLAHRIALRIFRNTQAAIISQLPMVVLMIVYTMLSLWIIAQPIVEA